MRWVIGVPCGAPRHRTVDPPAGIASDGGGIAGKGRRWRQCRSTMQVRTTTPRRGSRSPARRTAVCGADAPAWRWRGSTPRCSRVLALEGADIAAAPAAPAVARRGARERAQRAAPAAVPPAPRGRRRRWWPAASCLSLARGVEHDVDADADGLLLGAHDYADCPAFEQWLDAQRGMIAARRRERDSARLDACERDGRYAEGAALAGRLVAADALDEAAGAAADEAALSRRAACRGGGGIRALRRPRCAATRAACRRARPPSCWRRSARRASRCRCRCGARSRPACCARRG